MPISAHRLLLPLCTALVALTGLTAPARAQTHVKVYSAVPSEAELATDLFPAADLPNTRSLTVKGSDPDAIGLAPAPKRVGFQIQFTRDSSELSEESLQFVDRLGALLAKPDLAAHKLLVEGHTDATGPDDYNYKLSKRRAAAVADVLVSRYKIDASRLVVSARGEDVPLEGHTPEDPANRRVEFLALD